MEAHTIAFQFLEKSFDPRDSDLVIGRRDNLNHKVDDVVWGDHLNFLAKLVRAHYELLSCDVPNRDASPITLAKLMLRQIAVGKVFNGGIELLAPYIPQKTVFLTKRAPLGFERMFEPGVFTTLKRLEDFIYARNKRRDRSR